MRDFAKQARAALSVYLQRGATALAHFESGDVDSALETLRMRKAAYLNYRAGDVILLKQGIDIALESEVVVTINKIKEVDSVLQVRIEEARVKAESDLARIVNHRSKLGRYRSGLAESARFEKPA